MRRSLVFAALACALLTPTAAKAESVDPVAAVKRLMAGQFTAKVTEMGNSSPGSLSRVVNNTAKWFQYDIKRAGTIQLGRTGVVASDLTRRVIFTRDDSTVILKDLVSKGDPVGRSLHIQRGTHRSVAANGKLYTTGPLYTKGHGWALRGPVHNGGAFSDQIINVFEPKTLQRLLSDTDSKKRWAGRLGGLPGHKYVMVYGGTLTFADLYAVSPTFRATIGPELDAIIAKATVTWWLTTDMDGRPLKVSSMWDTWIAGQPIQPKRVEGSATTDFLSWRSGVTVKAPQKFIKVDGPAGGLPEFDDPMEVIREREKRE
jgi:hypothetical protein